MIPPSNHTNNEEPKGNLGRGVISLGQEKIDITKYSISEDESVREYNEEDDEDNKADTIDNSGGGIEELEDDKVIGTRTNNYEDHDNGKISSKEIPEEMTCLKERIQATRQVQVKKRHK